MVMLRPEPRQPETPPEAAHQPRLNLLISYGGWQQQSLAEQLPRLLEPLGVRCMQVNSGHEATQVIQRMAVHIAVVDLALPLHPTSSAASSQPAHQPAGARVLQLLRRLDQPPPTIVVRPPQASARESARSLADALREGAFAVLDRPVHMEAMLEVLRRILRRHYANNWPSQCPVAEGHRPDRWQDAQRRAAQPPPSTPGGSNSTV